MSEVSITGIEIRDIAVENLVAVSLGALVKRKPSPYVVLKLGEESVGKTKCATRKKKAKFKDIMFIQAKIEDTLKFSVYHGTINFLFGNDQFLGGVNVNMKDIVKNETKKFDLPLERADRGRIKFTIKSYNFGIDRPGEEETEGENEDGRKEIKESTGQSSSTNESTRSKTDSSITGGSEMTSESTGSSTIYQVVDSNIFGGNSGNDFLSAESFQSKMDREDEEEDEDEKESKYEIIRKIGGGGMGTVFLAIDKSYSVRKEVAIKKIKCKSIRKVNDSMQEIWPTRKLDHPNLCIVQDVFFTTSKESNKHMDSLDPSKTPFLLNLVMKYYPLGDLNTFIKQKKKSSEKIDSNVILSFMTQLTDALGYIHSNNVLHRDIKPENIFVDDNGKEVLIGDFGLARKFSTKSLASTSCGTPLYMAPEVMSSRRYNDKADIWSLGCVFYKLCALNLKKVFNMEVYANPDFFKEIHGIVVTQNGYPKWFSEVICRMLDKNGHKRPSASQLGEILKERGSSEGNAENIPEESVERKEEGEPEEDFSLVNWLELMKGKEWSRLNRCLIFMKEIKAVDGQVDFENEEISMTPLIYAQKNNKLGIMELLLDKGSAEPNESDNDGYTPLQRGVMWDQKEAIKLLLRFGAEPRMRSREGLTTFNYIDSLEKEHLLELFD